jgi:hypothetical protein
MGCCGNSRKKSNGSRKANSAPATQNKALSQSLIDQINRQNGQSVTPVRKKHYSPQYRYM